jgi:ABC-2 type transport system permease protein
MKSKTSLFKKGIIKSDLKRYWWVSALFALVLIFCLPFAHYMSLISDSSTDNTELVKEMIKLDLMFRQGISPIFPLVVPVIIAVLAFRYIQKGRSASFYHSLPLTRTALYLHSFVSALILYVVPLLVTVSLMLVLNWFSFLSAFYTTLLILKWFGFSLLFGILFMSMTIFVGMFTGSSIAQIVFVYILNLLPLFFSEAIKQILYQLLYGFETYSDTVLFDRLPLIMFLDHRLDLMSPAVVTVYIVSTALLLTCGLVAFKFRRPETAGDIITFVPVKPIFIYGVTLCATLFGGAYFTEISRSSIPFVIFGYFISSLFGYAVVQMITNKTFKILNTYKGYLIYALILIIVGLGVKFDALGYVNKVPDPNQVADVYIGNEIYWWVNKDNKNMSFLNLSSESTTIYKDPENIENIIKLHKLILKERSEHGNKQCISYKLKNGKRIIRSYNIDTDLYAPALGPVYESKEYMEGRFPILHQKADELKYIEIQDNDTVVISDKEQLESFITAIRKDIGNLSYRELVSNTMEKFFINITDSKGNTLTYSVYPNYKNTLEWVINSK